MITKPTVLVLGAGVSNPYGYPLGGELLESLYNSLKRENFILPIREFGIDGEIIKNFCLSFIIPNNPLLIPF